VIHADFHKENDTAGTAFSILSCPAIVRQRPNLAITTEESGQVRISDIDLHDYYLDHEDELGGCRFIVFAAIATLIILAAVSKSC